MSRYSSALAPDTPRRRGWQAAGPWLGGVPAPLKCGHAMPWRVIRLRPSPTLGASSGQVTAAGAPVPSDDRAPLLTQDDLDPAVLRLAHAIGGRHQRPALAIGGDADVVAADAAGDQL